MQHNRSGLVFKVPKRFMISSAEVKKTMSGTRLIQLLSTIGIDPLHFDHLLVLYELLVDKLNPESALQPYYDTFPSELPEFPSAWREEETAQLQAGSHLPGLL